MSRDELAALQGRRLVALVKYMYENIGYYKKKMQKVGLEPGDIRGIGDLNKLPFTTRQDLADDLALGAFAVKGSNIVHYQVSAHGAQYAGMGTVVGYTQGDLDVWGECMARSICMAGLGEKDIIQVACGSELCAEGLAVQACANRVRAAVVAASDCGPVALAALMRRLGVTGIVGSETQLKKLAQLVEERGWQNSLRLKAVICSGGAWPEGVRKKIQNILGSRVYDIFGLDGLTGPGVAGECAFQKGMHIQEDYFLPEIVDPDTMRVLPGGLRGQLVFTTLQKQGFPLIRYRTMGMTKLHYEICECGRTLARMDRITYGIDDVLLIRGNHVPISRIEEALSGILDREICYIICVRKERGLDVAMVCIVDAGRSKVASEADKADMKQRVAGAVSAILGLKVEVIIGADNNFGKFREVFGAAFHEAYQEALLGKKVAIVDERKIS